MNKVACKSRGGLNLPYFCIFALTFFFAASSNAQDYLTWNGCVEQALSNNPELVSARERLNQTRQDKAIVESGLFPQLTTAASVGRSQGPSQKAANKYTYGLRGEQLIFDGFKTASDVAASSREITAAQYDYYVISSNVRLDLRIAFVELLRAYALLEVTENIAKRRWQNSDLVDLLYQAGREHKGSLYKAKADLEQAKFEIVEANRNIALSQRRLLKAMGYAHFISVRVDGRLEEQRDDRREPDFELLSETTPFLNELIAKKETARFELKSAKADYFFPKVYADASLGKNDDKILSNENDWAFGLKFSYPLYEGGKRIANIKKMSASLGESEAIERSGRDGVIYTLQETWTRWQNAVDRIGVRFAYLEASKLRAKITQAEYANGLALFDNWDIIEDELSNDKKSYLNSLAEALIAKSYWIQAKGGILEDAEEK